MTTKITPFVLAFVCYLSLLLFQLFVIYPYENEHGSSVTTFASLVFLPHLVRVLSVWMLGPLAFFALLPADIIFQFSAHPDRQLTDLQMLVPFVSSGAAVITFELLKLTGTNLYMSATNRTSWRSLLLIGTIASVINSTSLSVLYQGQLIPDVSLQLVATYIVGDTIGLLFGLLALIILRRLLKLHAEH